MSDARDRLAGMSAQKRALLEKLLREKGIALSDTQAPQSADSPSAALPPASSLPASMISPVGEHAPEIRDRETFKGPEAKRWTRHFYDGFHDKCDATVFGRHSFFMNLGYQETEGAQESPVRLPDYLPNRASAKLALEVIGAADLDGRDVLDVGCGRGGTVHLMHEYFAPRRTVGVDLSPNGVAFCRRAHRYPNAEFLVGDAEDLPVEAAAFDFVTNVESSHSYPNRPAFYLEVARVLRPGGHFLYGDVLPVEAFDEAERVLGELGFEPERWRDVTVNVLRACEASADERYSLFVDDQGDEVMGDFMSVPGSNTYEGMASGLLAFRIARLRKGTVDHD